MHRPSLWPASSLDVVDSWALRAPQSRNQLAGGPRFHSVGSLPTSSLWWNARPSKVEPVPVDSPTRSSETRELAPHSLTLVLSDEPESTDGSGGPVELSLSLEEQLTMAFQAVEVGGYVTVEELPGVLAALKQSCDGDALQAAIQQVIPELEDGKATVSLDQALLILHATLEAKDKEPELAAREPTSVVNTADSGQNRTLCLLLTTVVGVIFLCAATVAGLAIMWLWLTSVNQSGNFLQMDLNLNEDMLRVMLHQEYTTQRQQLALDYAVIIGTLVEEMGYRLADNKSRDGLGTAAELLQRTVDAWWQQDAMAGLAETAAMMGSVMSIVAQNLSLTKAINLANFLNNVTLSNGQELLLVAQANNSFRYLSRLRYAADCNAGGCDLSPAANQPAVLALANQSGALRVKDYRGTQVVAGYANISALGLGVVFKMDQAALLESFMQRVGSLVDTLNAEATDQRTVMLARILPNGTKVYVSTLPECSADCLATATARLAVGTSAMGLALRGQSGIAENIDYRNVAIIAGYTFIPSIQMGVVVKVSRDSLKQTILQKLASILNSINAKFGSTEELELQALNGTQIVPLTTYRFADQCPNGTCNTSAYIKMAANGCKTGVAVSTDYRGKAVTAGYTCLKDLNAYVAYSVDQAEIQSTEVSLAVESTNIMNDNGATSYELVLGQPLNGTSRFAVSKGVGQDFTTLTRQRFATSFGCPGGYCRGRETCMQQALRGFEGILACEDYRDVQTLAAADYLDDLQLGFAAEVDMSEVMSPVLSTAYILAGVSCGALLGTAVLLSWYTRTMVRSMMSAEREGQDTILREKQRFSALVESMYPAYVVGRVLAGEQHIVQMLPHTAVFFSDIYNFTMASSKITSEELLELMGYTYGVMDKVAEHFHITKVKTVGDAYLAISGLPGVETENCCLDMMRFASTVAQVFSCKFDHPSQGEVLNLFQPRAAKKKAAGSSSKDNATTTAPSSAPTGAPSTVPRQSVATGSGQSAAVSDNKSVTSANTDPYGSSPKVRCIMAYGIAAGPVTAGVLQGKSPMFDIWGKTVNLASRMQSTGLPGRIQVSELFYKSIVAIPGQQYSFEESHQTMCKGFGMVRCYFVQSTTEAPPNELVELLGLEPNLGLFFYESPVSHIKGSFYERADHGSKDGASPHQSPHPPAHPPHHQSTAAATRPPPAPKKPPKNVSMSERTNPQVVRPEDPLALLEVDDRDD